MEKQYVTIQLKSSIQHPEQDEETHNLQLTGECIQKSGRLYLKFVETQDSEAVQTTVKLGEEDALIMRSGAVNMRLPFELEETRPGNYGNGPAAFELIVQTKRLEFVGNVSNGQFNVGYNLLAEGAILGTYKLSITYSEGTK
ncbi:YwiB family protein [Sporosarcina sp. CAU 1771]